MTRTFTSHKVLLPSGIQPATIVVKAGKISAVEAYGTEVPYADPFHFGTKLLMPGLTDTHVHINEPGRTEWEGFSSATMAAAAGGITTLIDMPLNCSPVTVSPKALEIKLASLGANLSVDCGFWGGAIPESSQLPDLLKAGVFGVKSFTIDSGLDEFPMMTKEDLFKAAKIISASGLPYLIHAELDDGLTRPKAGQSHEAFAASRPETWEIAAIEMLIAMMKATGVRVHIVHLSAAAALPAIAAAKQAGLPLTVETCPHYLLLESERIPTGATVFKCCPPIRNHSNREALWQGLKEGIIDFVVSDHSPCTPALKGQDGDFDQAWGGISSLQFGLSLLHEEAVLRGFTMVDIHRWLSSAPAAFLGLEGKKGAFRPGNDADLVIFDETKTWKIGEHPIHHRHKGTPYLGRRCLGLVDQTWLRGEQIYEHGRFPAPLRGKPLFKERHA